FETNHYAPEGPPGSPPPAKRLPGPGTGLSRQDFLDQAGTRVLSGLFFPRVVTPNPDNNNKEYSYTCRPPRIVRDFVAFCADDRDFWPPGAGSPGLSDFEPDSRTPDSLYLLPFKGTKVPLEQSNHGRWSHFPYTPEEFAYDFNTSYADDNHVYAARSGVVISENANYDGGTCVGCKPCVVDDPKHPGAMKPSGNCTFTNKVIVLHQDG